jgi:hypothetical protein
MARPAHSSLNILDIKYRVLTKLDVLGQGWVGGREIRVE